MRGRPVSARKRTHGEWNDDDYDVLADGVIIGHEGRGRAGRGQWRGGSGELLDQIAICT